MIPIPQQNNSRLDWDLFDGWRLIQLSPALTTIIRPDGSRYACYLGCNSQEEVKEYLKNLSQTFSCTLRKGKRTSYPFEIKITAVSTQDIPSLLRLSYTLINPPTV